MRELTLREQEEVSGGIGIAAGLAIPVALGGIGSGINYTLNNMGSSSWSWGGLAGTVVQGGVVAGLTTIAAITAVTSGGTVAAVSAGGAAGLIGSIPNIGPGRDDGDS